MHAVTLHLPWSRAEGGEDVAALLRDGLGTDANGNPPAIEAELDKAGAVVGYSLHMWFPTPEAAFDAALTLRNFCASEGWPCTID
jgi:hypothetical protein